ncbi:MAG: hypothetical protein V3T56_03370 [Gemmatimonadales bacterium]
MTETDSPLGRSIGLSGVIRLLIAVAVVVAVGAAFADGHYMLGIAGIVFVVAALIMGYRVWHARQ